MNVKDEMKLTVRERPKQTQFNFTFWY